MADESRATARFLETIPDSADDVACALYHLARIDYAAARYFAKRAVPAAYVTDKSPNFLVVSYGDSATIRELKLYPNRRIMAFSMAPLGEPQMADATCDDFIDAMRTIQSRFSINVPVSPDALLVDSAHNLMIEPTNLMIDPDN